MFYENLFCNKKNILRKPKKLRFQHFGKASIHFTVADLGSLSKLPLWYLAISVTHQAAALDPYAGVRSAQQDDNICRWQVYT